MTGQQSTILVTGNMGYVGPSVVERLRRTHPATTLIGLDTGFFAPCLTNTRTLPECSLDCQHFADVRSAPRALLDGVDAVVHLAGISNDPIGNAYAELTMAINCDATVRLARMAKEAGVRAFVFASSCSIYGFSEEDVTTESAPARPQTPYAESKWRAENRLRDLATEDFVVTSLRFATACGMSKRLRLDLVLNDFVASALVSKQIDILSDGSPWRPLIHVEDMARACDWAIGRGPLEPESFLAVNVGADDMNYRIRELADLVQERVPGVDVVVDPAGGPDKRSYRVGFELFRQLAPDHQPTKRLETAVDDLRAGLEAMQFEDPEFRRSRLVRLVALEGLRQSGSLDDHLEWMHGHDRRAGV